MMRASRVESGGSAELGGHIASYASAADLFEVGFNHFFRARDDASAQLGDLVFFQPHSAPGVYARAHLEGGSRRITSPTRGARQRPHRRRARGVTPAGQRGMCCEYSDGNS
jgi:pyruvate dehydrogenase E1 component